MPLDPQSQALLDLQKMTGFPGFDRMPLAEARRAIVARSASSPREEVARVEDRAIPSGVPVRLYWPLGPEVRRPALLFFHGGGWVMGNLETVDPTCRTLANASGCVIASVDYRHAPEHRYPAAAEDAFEALGWLALEAQRLGVDPDRIAVGGDSAGGNLAIVAALMARDRDKAPPAFQLLVYPVADHAFDTPSYLRYADGYGLTLEAMRTYWNHYLPRPEAGVEPYASPLRADLWGLPPAHVITVEYDPLRDEAERLADRLRSSGAVVTSRRYEGQLHGFFHLGHLLDAARCAVLDAAAVLRHALDAPCPATAPTAGQRLD